MIKSVLNINIDFSSNSFSIIKRYIFYFAILGSKRSKYSLENNIFSIQDTQIGLIKVSKLFYSKMPTAIIFVKSRPD